MFEVGDLVVKVLDDNRGGLKREYVREILMSFPTYILVGADHAEIMQRFGNIIRKRWSL